MNKIKFIGATNGVTGSSTYIEVNGLKILIDIGLQQGNLREIKETMGWNGRDLEYNPSELDYVVITHAHIDHSGCLPLLFKRGFRGEVITTVPTAKFMEISLPDSAEIMASDCEWYRRNMKQELEPPYSIEDAKESLNWIRCYDFDTEIVLNDEVKLLLKRAGHMLGAAMPVIKYKNKRKWKSVLFTGDTSGFTYQKPFLPRADELGNVDMVVCESTYGDRRHKKQDFETILRDSILNTCIHNKGTLVIPVFAMQRSSEILWLLREIFMADQQFHHIPIYLDSPMACDAQRVVDEERRFWGEKWLDRDDVLTSLFEWENIQYVKDFRDSRMLANNNVKIILSSSGMCSAGRVTNHLSTFLPDKQNKVLLCGYAAKGTVSGELRDIAEGLTNRRSVSINGNRVDIRADIEPSSFSSHADYNQLTELLKTGKMKQVFLVHGEKEAKQEFKNHLKGHLKGVRVDIPKYNTEYKL